MRQALWYAFNQEDFLKAVIGDPSTTRPARRCSCAARRWPRTRAWTGCSSPTSSKAQALLKEAGYDGTPIVLMHSTDLDVLTNLAPVAKKLMEKAGFKVDMQSMDWQTLVARRAKKEPPNAGGWHAFLTSWVSADITNPDLHGLHELGCDKAMFGWPCDAEMEKLRDEFARETDPAKQKAIAEAVQVRATQVVSHIPRPVVSAGRCAQERRRHPDGAGAGVLEHRRPVADWPTSRRREPRRRPLRRTGTHARLRAAQTGRDHPRDADRRGARLPDAAADAIRSGRHHRRRQCQHRAGGRDPASGSGLDQPILTQFFIWIGKTLQGDFGESFFFKKQVAELILDRLEPTLALALFTIASPC